MGDDQHVWLTDKQAGVLLGCTDAAVLQLRLRGQLSYLNSRPPRIRLSDLNMYIARTAPGDKAPTPAEQALLDGTAASVAHALMHWHMRHPRAPRKRRGAQ